MRNSIHCLLMIGLFAVGSIASWAQGTLNFSNGAAGVNAPVYDLGGTIKLAGSGYVADLYYGAAGANEQSLIPLGANVGFATGASAGYFFGGPRAINGFAAGEMITAQVRVWSLAAGTTYESALQNGFYGKSSLLTITLGGGVLPAANLVGLNSFAAVPEPSSALLSGCGAAMLLLLTRSHRKTCTNSRRIH